MGVNCSRRKLPKPSSSDRPLATRVVEVPRAVPMPASTVRKERGISRRDGETPSRRHQRSTTGMNIATTAVLLSTALKGPTTTASNSNCWDRSAPAKPASQRSIGSRAPVRTTAALITNIATTARVAGLPKPARACWGVSQPARAAAITRASATSSRGRRRRQNATNTARASSKASSRGSLSIDPSQVPAMYQQLGEPAAIVAHMIEPSLEDGLKAVASTVTAEQLGEQLAGYHLSLDGIDLLQLDFCDRFRRAVEARQVAEQDGRRAQFEAANARRQAEARVFQAEGEARAQQLLQAGLTPALLERQAIEKWNGHLPLVMGGESRQCFDLKSLLQSDTRLERRR